jgi:hypothetical protein
MQEMSSLGIDVGRFRDRICMPVASISIVEMAVNGPLLCMMGDRSYLREYLRERVGTEPASNLRKGQLCHSME